MLAVRPGHRSRTDDAGHSVRFLTEFFATQAPELSGRWHYRHLHEESFGMSQSAFSDVARSADLYLSVSGAGIAPDGLRGSCTKVFLDTDPGYNQILLAERPSWADNMDRWCEGVADHDRHFTYAENIDGADCRVPSARIRWVPTRMPVVLEAWAGLPPAADDHPWTTVMAWNTVNGPLVHQGTTCFGKGAEVERILELPSARRSASWPRWAGPRPPSRR